MENSVKSNYLGTKFLLDNLKKDKNTIFKTSETLKSYSVEYINKDIMHKTYFDTPDFYLHQRGIVININTYKGKQKAELVVRYESEKQRIEFLSDIPDTFATEISAKDSIFSHAEFIADAISQPLPYGIEVDGINIVRQCIKVFDIEKKRENYRVINIQGLKCTFSFTTAVYKTNLNRNVHKTELLEIESNTVNKVVEYSTLRKLMVFEFPKLVETFHSDFLIAKNNLM